MSNVKVLIQASSRSWAGGRDICMGLVNGEIAVVRTIRHALAAFPDAQLCLVAPEFDRDGELNKVVEIIADKRLTAFYGFDESPLKRMIAASIELTDDDYIVRVDGIHFCFDFNLSQQMLTIAQQKNLDCIKLPADFPVHFSSEIFRVGALRELANLLTTPELAKFHVHPKTYFELNRYDYKFEHLKVLPQYSDEYLNECRQLAQPIYEIPRQEVNSHRIASGDILGYHYQIALKYLKKNMRVLDIACADGYGVRMMSSSLSLVHGADLDAESVNFARQNSSQQNVEFFVEDITNMSFDDNSYDGVTCFETLEHVPEDACLKELLRIIKPGGMLILSTPQNSYGHIPVNSCHLVEYNLDYLLKLTGQYFHVVKVIGIKAGIIHDDADPYGTNTVLVCIKPIR
ncbi:class I SAM-dependent methyltransferase [Shewanella xiamenensis]|uniref:class I SAM-dependent methyltransferase n=1 Tax=Shewanella xiamenensis TaxID=332186 RepID=UPI001CC765A5|nr:class I SAM-dependent methyltransferase [Shewanella xiamenensis]MCT8857929.1 class I SAM-dependent methyltransferase [Shewanella xiamenensis]UWG63544.1 class I SAM-dependent methyltransferase [Shewanella xiamenensis]BDA59841.1 type 11 methyltransferase [Shewanella xiamenensis]